MEYNLKKDLVPAIVKYVDLNKSSLDKTLDMMQIVTYDLKELGLLHDLKDPLNKALTEHYTNKILRNKNKENKNEKEMEDFSL